MFYDIFVDLCSQKGVSPNKACIEMGLSRSLAAKWKSTKTNPSLDVLKKISLYFDVTTDYLMGKENSEQKESSPYSELDGTYLNFAKEAKESGIHPDDIKLAIETIKRLRGK